MTNKVNTIKFSHLYFKMPNAFWDKSESKTTLIGISIVDTKSLPKEFIDWDTAYPVNIEVNEREGFQETAYYELFKGKGLILLLFTVQKLDDGQEVKTFWTTIRSWNPNKENYYQNLIGQEVKIEVET